MSHGRPGWFPKRSRTKVPLPWRHTLIAREDMLEAVGFAGGPWFAEESPVHSWEVTLALPQFGGEEGHTFDEARVVKPPRIKESKWAPIHQFDEFLFGCYIIANDENVAHGTILESWLVKHLPPHIFEGPNDASARETLLDFLRGAGVPWKNKIVVAFVERIADVDPEFAVEPRPKRLQGFEHAIAQKHGRQHNRGFRGGFVAPWLNGRNSQALCDALCAVGRA